MGKDALRKHREVALESLSARSRTVAVDEVGHVTGSGLKYWSEVTSAGLKFLVLVGHGAGAGLEF